MHALELAGIFKLMQGRTAREIVALDYVPSRIRCCLTFSIPRHLSILRGKLYYASSLTLS